MKTKVSNFLVLAAFFLILAVSVQAQEGMPVLDTQDSSHRDLNLGEDKTLNNDIGIHSQTVRDTIQAVPHVTLGRTIKSSKPDANRNNSKEADEDALSFNFLYYMLQKFKMSDLIDQ